MIGILDSRVAFNRTDSLPSEVKIFNARILKIKYKFCGHLIYKKREVAGGYLH